MTLIEILVLLAILILLGGMLVPAFVKVSQRAIIADWAYQNGINAEVYLSAPNKDLDAVSNRIVQVIWQKKHPQVEKEDARTNGPTVIVVSHRMDQTQTVVRVCGYWREIYINRDARLSSAHLFEVAPEHLQALFDSLQPVNYSIVHVQTLDSMVVLPSGKMLVKVSF